MRTMRKQTESSGHPLVPDVKTRRTESYRDETLEPLNCGSVSTFSLPDIKPEDDEILRRADIATEISHLKAQIVSYKNVIKNKEKQIKKLEEFVVDPNLVESINCKNPDCKKEFVPQRLNSKFCSRECCRKYFDKKRYH